MKAFILVAILNVMNFNLRVTAININPNIRNVVIYIPPATNTKTIPQFKLQQLPDYLLPQYYSQNRITNPIQRVKPVTITIPQTNKSKPINQSKLQITNIPISLISNSSTTPSVLKKTQQLSSQSTDSAWRDLTQNININRKQSNNNRTMLNMISDFSLKPLNRMRQISLNQ